jgi:hypothetical protein
MTLSPLERGLELFAIIHLALMGLSHVLHHRAWAEFFVWLRGHGQAGVFVHGFLSLAFGAMIVAFHPVWAGLPMVLSVVGVLYLVKAVQCFLFPAVSLRSLGRVTVERSRIFMAPGVVFLGIAVIVAMGVSG